MSEDAAQFQACESMKQKSLQSNKNVFKIITEMAKRGCFVDLVDFAKCTKCDPALDGGVQVMEDGKKQVILCQNNIKRQDEMDNTLAHELVHVYDYCRAKIDWTNCRHHACTEVRAANLSGDCTIGMELARGHFNLTNHREACVKRRATKSVASNPHCVNQAKVVVDEVYARCERDVAPFEF